MSHTSTLTTLRSLTPKRTLHSAELPALVERQAAALRRQLGVRTDAFDEQLITQMPRIKVVYEDDLPSSGMTFWDGQMWIIVLNKSEPETRQRFSMIHELHHIVAHPQHHQLFPGQTNKNNPLAERTADLFAGCVLMPKILVKRYWGQGPRDVDALAERFDVSTGAMRFRLHQLGLIDEAVLKPRSLFSREIYEKHMNGRAA